MGNHEQRWLWGCARRVVFTVGLMVIGLLGCGRQQATQEMAAPPPPGVTVAAVTQQTIPIYLDYIGSTAAVRSVDIRARVEGFLQKRAFTEGADVKEGDLLFGIDPSPFQAALEQAQAQLAGDEAALAGVQAQLLKDKASLAYAREQVERYRSLANQEFVTREAFDNYRTQADQAAAAVAADNAAINQATAAIKADRAAITQAKLNLSYCTIRAPMSGRIGRALVDVGNLVGPGENSVLASIVQLDPIYVYFSASARELAQIVKHQQQGELPATVMLANQSTHPHQGKVDFLNNTMDAATATLKMRAIAPNPEKTLFPGQYARVRLLVARKPDALLVPAQAVGDDQAGQYVLVVGQDNKVERRSIVAGATYQSLRVVEKGVQATERVITEGFQKVQAGIVVQPKLAAPTDGARTPATAAPVAQEASK
jgi:multidrug efflux pump subunit AcrA (membrane-fusion protein)